MGEVYRAYDERLDRKVALKQVGSYASGYPRVRERFRREARAAARLNHPAIVQIYDVLESEGADWIVMELVEGQTLARLLGTGPLPPVRAVATAREVSEGLAAAHAEGIVHRDLKSENVMVTSGGRAKILDFGLAKQLWRVEGDVSLSLSLDGNLLGTTRSMSPEQPLGKKVDHRSDLFSLGTLLYEMVTGKSPFLGPTAVETAIRVCSHRQAPVSEHVPGVPPELSELVDRLLEKEPEGRPGSAAEVAAELERITLRMSRAPAPVAELPAHDSGGGRIGESAGHEPSGGGMVVAAPTPSSAGGERRERRQITVLCCDLVAADGAYGALDPETVYDLTHDFQGVVREAIRPFEGHVGNVLDHRVLVYFGYPQALEDDARRAVHAALDLVARIGGLRDRPPWAGGGGMAVRVGVHTGPAVVLGGASGGERVILGETLDLAAGIQRLADPGGVVVSAETRRLIDGYFTVRDLGPTRLPGLDRPLALHRVEAARDVHGRVEAEEPAPMVARERERELLLDRWRLAREGSAQLVLLGGEPGIGKSRLRHDLGERAVAEGGRRLVLHGSPYTRSTPFHPVIKLFHRLLGFTPRESPDRQLGKLETFLRGFSAPLSELVPAIASLLSLPSEDRHTFPEPGAGDPKVRLRETLVELFLEMAEKEPLFLAVEEADHLDPSTLDLLGQLVHRAAPILTLMTFRSGFQLPWSPPANLTHLTLGRLTAPQVERLIERIADDKPLPREVRRQIVDKTDGVPLFVEELTRSVLESGLVEDDGEFHGLRGPLRSLSVPATLHASLMTRLDRQGPAKEVAQLAAALGRELSYELLAAVAPHGEVELQRHLDRLVKADLLHRRGSAPRIKYAFKHALVQEAAYGSLLKRERQALHRRIAEVLDGWMSETGEIPPEQLAHHHASAGNLQVAVGYWVQAGRRAIERAANLEAMEHLERGLELLQQMPESEERGLQELSLLTTLGPVLSNLRSFEGPEVEHVYTRAGELCLQLGNAPEHFWVLRGISAYFIARARPRTTLELVRKLMRLAEAERDAPLLLESHYAVGWVRFCLGELAAAREHLERGVALDDADRDRPHLARTGEDSGVACLAALALVLWHQGLPEQACRRSDEAIALAREIGHPGTLAGALALAGWLHQLRRDREAVHRCAEEAIAIAEEQGMLLWLTHGELLLGWARSAAPGQLEIGGVQERMRQSLDAYRGDGVLLGQTYLLAVVAEAERLQARDFRLLQEALAAVEDSGERFFEAELHRLCGELLLAGERGEGDDAARRREEAESHFEQALEVARRQGARALELRAAVSLVRLRDRQGRGAEVRAELAALVEGYEEGRSEADLLEARALLGA